MDREARNIVGTAIQQAVQRNPVEVNELVDLDGKGLPLIFVDAGSLKTHWSRWALAWRAIRTHAVIYTNLENLRLPGVAARQVRYRPAAFSSLQSAKGISLGLVSVSLAAVLGDLAEISRQGQGIHFLQTSVIRLDPSGIGKEHQDILRAAERAWILNSLFQLSVPARSLDWRGIIQTLTSIARNA